MANHPNRRKLYTVTRTEDQDDAEFAIRLNGRRIGSLCILSTGYCDWTFIAGANIPSLTTQRKLVEAAKQSRA